MPIQFASSRAGDLELIAERYVPASSEKFRATTTGAGTREVSVTAPHAVYVVPGEALERGEFLAAARLVSWRYLLVRSEEAFAAAEVTEDANGALAYAGTNEGPFVQETVNVLEKAERLDDVQRGDFELRLLRVPAAYFVALWLRGQTSDLVLPLAPAPAGLEAGRAYAPDELVPRLRPIVEENRRSSERPRPS